MRKFLVLTRLQLRSLLASLRVGGSRKRAASGVAAVALMAAVCVYVSGVYSFALGGQLAQVGALELLLILMPGMAAVGGLAFTAFAAQGVVFGGRDADLLLSMPVPAFTVLLSKLTALYVENLLICVFLVLPAGAAWIWFGGEDGALLLVRLAVGTPFLAMLPTALSLAAGFLLSWLGSRFGNRKLVNLLLYGLLVAAVMAFAFQINLGITGAAEGALGEATRIPVWGVPFLLFQKGVCGDWETLAMFCLMSLAPVLAAAWLFAKNYQQVLTGLQSHGRRAAYRIAPMTAAGRRTALLKKEASRYFGTPIYLFNTGIGLVMLPVAGVAAAVMGERLLDQLVQEGVGDFPLEAVAVAGVCFLLSTVAITGSSISLEGRNLWILKEAPVSAGEIFAAKAGFQLLLEGPCLLPGCAGLAWGLGLTLAEGAALLLLGGAFAGCTALWGLIANLCLPKLDALNDMVVVKQSAAAMAATFGAMALAVGAAVLVWQLGGMLGALSGLLICALILLVGCGGEVLWLRSRGAKRFLEL